MSLPEDRKAFIDYVRLIAKEPVDQFTRVLDNLIEWSRSLNWAIEFLTHDGTQKLVKFVIRGTETPFWTASPGHTVPTKLGIIDSAPPTFPSDVQKQAIKGLAELDATQLKAKAPAITFEALCSGGNLEQAKIIMRELLTKLSAQRTKELMVSGVSPIVGGKTWLGHVAADGSGKIDVMLLDGATRAEMAEARGAVDQHLNSIRRICNVPVVIKWGHYVYDRRALGAPAVVAASVSRQKSGKDGAADDIELRIYGRERLKVPFGEDENAPVTLRSGGKKLNVVYHATPGNAGFTYLYQAERKGTGGQTLAEFLTAGGYSTGSRVELTFLGNEVTLRKPSGKSKLTPPPTPAASTLEPPPRVKSTVSRVVRDTAVALSVKEKHDYRCQVCGERITLPDGSFYAEAHHIRPLGGEHKGYDVEENVLCVCPNHHAELDFGMWDINLAELRVADGHTVGEDYVRYHNETIRNRWK